MNDTLEDKRRACRPTAALLIPIWERVLQRSPIEPDENFFEISGDPRVAASLFAEISRVTGREIPLTVIYEAPTVASLATVLDRRGAFRSSSVVLLKPGTDFPPVFMAHGLGGTVIELWQLAKCLRLDHPVYGIQARGLDGGCMPHDRVEAMAQHFLDAIGTIQSRGPYILIGNSFGGLVALEVAQRLRGRGEEIAFLGLLDTYPHPRYWPLRAWLNVLRRRAAYHTSRLRELKPKEVGPYVARRLQSLHGHLRSRCGGSLKSDWTERDDTGLSSLKRVIDSGIAALAHYRPQHYPGKITFLRAETTTQFPENGSTIWARLVKELEIHTVPGDHVAMSTVHADTLAEQLSRGIEIVLGSM